jgi:DNA-directed RNA polymerase subunit RPC12/RpoP
MGIMDTVSAVLESSTQRAPGEGGDDGSEGSYWCDDCGRRVRDVDVDAEGLDRDEDDTPLCPDCGDAMRFERASGSGCAC